MLSLRNNGLIVKLTLILFSYQYGILGILVRLIIIILINIEIFTVNKNCNH